MSDDFLSRWSRRKREAGADEPVVPEPPAAEPDPETRPEESDDELLARLGFKHPEEMEPGDDFAAFLHSAVPRHLKTIAYRRLWRSNPTLACVDGLNDYDGDFTGTGVPETGLKTAYRVGRGLIGRITEVAENPEKEVPAEDARPAVDTSAAVDAFPTADVEKPAFDADGGSDAEPPREPEIVQQNDTPRPAPRRMVFRAKG